MLDCGEITRDYGIEQKTARIEKNSGKKFKLVSGFWIGSIIAAVGM